MSSACSFLQSHPLHEEKGTQRFDNMAWTQPEHSHRAVNQAGGILIDPHSASFKLWFALDVVNNWRSSHSYPLQALKMNLLNRAKSVDSTALVAQRIKRLPSIELKLVNNPNMKLSQMQDLGGCRAVLRTIRDLYELVDNYEISIAKNPKAKNRPVCIERYDYVENPKLDGYRSFHYVYKYRSKSPTKLCYRDLRIEIQLRSRLQHIWATAVETASIFTGYAFKSSIGDVHWKRFFALMGTRFAIKERSPTVPNTPADERLVEELRDLSQRLDVETALASWGKVVQVLEGESSNVSAYLLVLNTEEKKIYVKRFTDAQLREATDYYMEIERETKDSPETQAVLVSVDSLTSLKRAYPNYYLDTSAFIHELKEAIS